MKIFLISFACSFLTLVLVYAGGNFFNDNFHAVIPGILYRSAEPSGNDINHYAKRYGIRTIINLRGANPGSDWYDKEIEQSSAYGIKHIDFRMSAKRNLTIDQAHMLINIMRDAPKPLLVHCNAGANRSSLASALYIAAVSKGGEEAAESQLKIIYGNLPHWLDRKNNMNEAFELLETMLGYYNS
jgi:protein tyrosine/serine phosphatase